MLAIGPLEKEVDDTKSEKKGIKSEKRTGAQDGTGHETTLSIRFLS